MRTNRFAALFSLVCALISATSLGVAQPGLSVQERYGQTQKLVASDAQANADFGNALVLSDDGQVLVVAAPSQNVGENDNQGQVYVYRRQGATWVEVQKLVASDGAAGDKFGAALAISAGPNYTILIGGPEKSGEGIFRSEMGGAYVFTFNGTSWSQQAKLEPVEDNYYLAYNHRGASVAITADGLKAFVGAPGVDVGETINAEGVIYVFEWVGDAWVQIQKIEGSFDGYGVGWSLHLSDSEAYLLAAGSYYNQLGADQRVVHIYEQVAGSWTRIFDLVPSDGEEFSKFGAAIATANGGSMIMVGAPDQSGPQGVENGKVYIFTKSGAAWVETSSILHPDGIYNFFGQSLALTSDGKQAVIGAWLNGSGAVYWFEQVESGWQLHQRLTTNGSQEHLGYAVASRGVTIVAGARDASTGEVQWAGATYVFDLMKMTFLPLIAR